jgi:hypothetical protein
MRKNEFWKGCKISVAVNTELPQNFYHQPGHTGYVTERNRYIIKRKRTRSYGFLTHTVANSY